MREIKFRAYIKFGLEPEKDYMLYGPVNFEKGIIIDTGISASYPIKDLVLQQFTGLKDKNGKEIWEGDIVQYEKGKYSDHNYEVIFDKGQFSQKDNHSLVDIWYEWNELEVIGYSYENPENQQIRKKQQKV